MGKFVELYVKPPLEEVGSNYASWQPIYLENRENNILVRIGDRSFSIPRHSTE